MTFEGKRIFISGGTGSWGQALTRRLLECNPEQVVIYSRNEGAQVEMERAFCDNHIRFIIGDIRDDRALDKAMGGVDYVFHSAALKHVPVCENQVSEALKTNIVGTQNMIDCARKHRVKKFVDISTDKVVDPANLYGMTKAIAEKLTIQANCESETDFIVTRTGNVLGSNGSIVPHWLEQIRTRNQVTVTDRNMARFFITLPAAIDTLLYAVENGRGGEIFVKDIEAFYITNLATLLVEKFGNKDTGITFTGIREGEKIDESLIAEHELPRTYRQGDYFVIYPQIKTGRDYTLGTPVTEGLKVKNRLSSRDRLEKLLIEGGLI